MTNNMSFLPEDYLQQRIARRTNVICLTLFVVVMGGVIAAWFVTDRQRQEIQILQDKANGDFEEAARRLDQLEQLQTQKDIMMRKVDVTSILVEKVPRSLLLAELINHMPPALSLLELELKTTVLRKPRGRTSMEKARRRAAEKKNNETSVPKTELGLSLIGLAPTDEEVAEFMGSLNTHKLFNSITLQYSEQTKIDDRMMRKFRLHMTVNQNIDPQRIEATWVRRNLNNNPMSDQIFIDKAGPIVLPKSNAPTEPNTQ